MKMKQLLRRRRRNHFARRLTTPTGIAGTVAGILAGALVARQIPDLIRYLKIERM